MAKQLNVNLAFNAETAQARKAIEDLSQSLRKIQVQPSKLFDDTDLKKASQAAQDLEKHLRAALNVDTGKLDLNKFSQSLASSKQNLSDLYKDLSRAGEEGQTAFLNLARSINAADSSTLNLGSKLRELSTTLKNTARWEISSKIMHGFESAISSAYNYAQDLNKSLTDIRIVTGQSSEEMAQFAERANKAAKALSTTTTNYTDASLIYYQQGLSNAEVAERTEVTIKMANAAGVSAQTVSDQMTAVWNNFDNGSKSLEYYADVMTALGAATASSTDEISEGLNKFAAVAETVGLSYEYATAALATVTSETRESADVVGTAYKTLFARIQGLQQGETLDDGTSLNKYSAALAKVGIDIKDVNGDMKDMDTILNEMGAKWGTLAKDQQLALAQTVAGVRQYTQLVALMDNWGTFQENLNTAYNAEGALQEQADIYAESWEAASKRVQAAAEGIYQELLNDDFFIDILNGFELFLTGVNEVIDGVGGLKTILLSVGGLVVRQYAKEIPSALSTLSSNFDIITGKAKKTKQETLDNLVGALNQEDVSGVSNAMNAEIQTITRVSEMNAQLNKVKDTLSDTELAYYENKLKYIEAYGAEAAAIGKEKDALEKLIETKEEAVTKEAVKKQESDLKQQDEEIKKQEELLEIKRKIAAQAEEEHSRLTTSQEQKDIQATQFHEVGDESNYIIYRQQALDLEEKIAQQAIATKQATDEVTAAEQKLAEMRAKRTTSGQITTNAKDIKKEIRELERLSKQYYTLDSVYNKMDDQEKSWKKHAKSIEGNTKETDKLKKSIKAYVEHLKEIGLTNVDIDLSDDEQSAQKIVETFEKWRNIIGNIDTSKMDSLENEIDSISKKLAAMGVSQDALDDLATQFQSMALTTEESRAALERLNLEAEEIPKHTMSVAESIGVMAGTALELWGAIEAIKNIGSIWTNDDLSTGEKIFQTISAMIPVIMTLTQLTGEQHKAQLMSAGSAIAEALGLTTKAAAAGGATVATKGLTGALQKLYITLGPIGLILVIIAAAMAAVAVAAWGLSKAFEWIKSQTPEGKLKALEEQAQKSADAFDRVSESVKATDEALQALNEQYKTIENLTKGTTEWYEAISNVNAQVMSLLEKYPELAQYVSQTEDGVMYLSQEGQDVLSDMQYERYQAASNIKTRDQIDVKREEYNQSLDKYKDSSNTLGYSQDEVVQGLIDLYNNPQYGEQMFTQRGAAQILNTLVDADQLDTGVLNYNIPEGIELTDNFKGLTSEQYEDFYNDLIANQELIRQTAAEQQQIKLLEDSLFASRVSATGTNRSLAEVKDMLDGMEYSDLFESSRDKVEQTFGDWNDHKNYDDWDDTTDAEWKMIEDFMNLQGDNVEYVAQRHGKMVLEVDGEEIEYTKDEVYDALAELYTGNELETRLTESLTQTLGNSLKGVNLEGLELDELVQLDNLSMAFDNALVGTSLEGQGNDLLNQVIASKGSNQEDLQNYLASIQNLDLTNAENLREFNSAAMQLAEGKISVEEFTHALDEMNAAATLEGMDSYFAEAAERYGMSDEDAENMHAYAQHLMEIADESANLSDELTTNADSAADLAVEITRMNKGVKKLADGFEDWKDVLKKSSRESAEYAEALWDMKDALSDVLDVESNLISEDFVQRNMEQIEKASEGSAEAIDYLRSQMDEEIIQRVTLGQTEDFTAEVMNLQTLFTNELNRINTELPDIEVGAILQDEAFIAAANNLVQSASMTADEANAYFAGIGYEPVYAVEDIDNSSEVPQSQTRMMPEVMGTMESEMSIGPLNMKVKIPKIAYNQESIPLDPAEAPGTTRLVSFSGGDTPPTIRGLRKKATGSSNNYSGTNSGGTPAKPSSGGGGGSSKEPSKPKKIDVTGEQEIVERYKEVTDALDNVSDSMTKVQMEADVLWGKKHINNLKEQNKLLDEQIELLDRQYEEAKAYQEQDEADLKSAASALGVSLTIDPETGDVTNIEDAERSIYDQLAAAEAHYNSLATGEEQDSYEETILEPLRQKIEAFETARNLYYDSVETAEDAEIARREAELQRMANNFQIWSEGLEFEIEFNEKDLEMLEFWISRLEDNVYEMAEAAALMVGEMDDLASGLFGEQLAIYNENLQNADTALADLNTQFAAGEITEAAYHEGLDAIREQYMENIQALQDLDNAMMEYYENTLSAAQDELSKYTDQMEHQTEVLEHYQSLLELMGKSNDYKMIGEVLKGQVETTKNQATVSKQWYESRRADADALKADYEAAKQAGASDEELELLEKNWQDAEAVANEAQDQMLSDAEAWAEALKALLENELNDLGQTLENQLSGKWGSFDEMTTAMERANSLQEEYLTTTNQIYETNKLMRTAQQEIDKTTNSVAKKKLQAYINETQQLQDQSKLSQYELEIQQAKYNLLLAEIALEEAQDAKSTVRLQRDSEGNFGYVYTADSSKIAEAQQQLEDAQNDLYNIGLEGANGYAEKYQQTMAEMYDTLRDLQDQYQDGAFESEAEYQEAVTRATDYYYQQLKDFSSLYQISLTTDSRVIADAWSTDFADMTYQTEQWMTYVKGYNNDVIKAFKDWQDAVSGPGGVTDIVGNSVETVAGNVKDVTDKSKDLAEVTTETVIPALDNEIKAVANLTGEYAKLRDTIQEIITKYGLMIETINGNEENEYNSTEDGSNGGSSGNSNSNGGSSDGSSSSSSGDSSSGEGSTAATVTPATATVFYKGRKVKVNNDATTFSALSQNKTMDDWVPGEQFQAYSTSGDEVLIGDPKRAGTYTGWVNASDLTALNTGGYTGEWGPYGKLAMLHEKELILNPSDTANFLSSMEVLERILQIIDLQSASSQLGGILSSPGVRDTGSVIEQSIHIEASFPAAQNRNEIEEAFNNMFNKASQYANRK